MKSPAALLLSLLLAACGGKVVIDTGSPPEPGEPPVSTCEVLCKSSIAACGGTASECEQSCAQTEATFADVCTAEWQAFVTCAVANPAAQCQNTNACDDQAIDLTSCFLDKCTADPEACMP